MKSRFIFVVVSISFLDKMALEDFSLMKYLFEFISMTHSLPLFLLLNNQLNEFSCGNGAVDFWNCYILTVAKHQS